jgi:hypothetical protein
MECYHDQPRKRHAQLRHQPRSVPLWAGDPDDWALALRKPRPPLVCPEPGCGVELISYENPGNQHNPRIFKFKAGGRSCDHWADRSSGGGPESAQHEWMKYRLARIARRLSYTATPEHPPTRADVFVHEPSYCLEVQLVHTQFRQRTIARQDRGTSVCWLIREGLDTPAARTALFQLPAVRFRITDQDNPKGRLLAPWEHPDDTGLARRARLQVFGTVAHAPRENQRPGPSASGPRWFRTGTMTATSSSPRSSPATVPGTRPGSSIIRPACGRWTPTSPATAESAASNADWARLLPGRPRTATQHSHRPLPIRPPPRHHRRHRQRRSRGLFRSRRY